MTLYKKKEQLFLETNTLGVGLGASLLQARDGMQFPKVEACDNVTLWTITFTRKA